MSSPKDINKKFNNAGGQNPPKPPSNHIKPVAMPVSKNRIDELHKQLSKPKTTITLTPMGSVTRKEQSQADRAILTEVEEIRKRLELRRNAAKEAFGRAHDDQTVRRGRRM